MPAVNDQANGLPTDHGGTGSLTAPVTFDDDTACFGCRRSVCVLLCVVFPILMMRVSSLVYFIEGSVDGAVGATSRDHFGSFLGCFVCFASQ